MKPCPYIELKYNRRGTWAAKGATLCALPENHSGLHLQQSAREMRKWAVLVPVSICRSDEEKLKAWLA